VVPGRHNEHEVGVALAIGTSLFLLIHGGFKQESSKALALESPYLHENMQCMKVYIDYSYYIYFIPSQRFPTKP
jgi:hypothetical protein